jgi:hypothetical protein
MVMKTVERRPWAPEYMAKNMLAVLGASQQLHAEAAPIEYGQVFVFLGTQVATNFLLRVGSHRRFLTSLRSETYTSQSARTFFHLLVEAHNLCQLSFAHISSSKPRSRRLRLFGVMLWSG